MDNDYKTDSPTWSAKTLVEINVEPIENIEAEQSLQFLYQKATETYDEGKNMPCISYLHQILLMLEEGNVETKEFAFEFCQKMIYNTIIQESYQQMQILGMGIYVKLVQCGNYLEIDPDGLLEAVRKLIYSNSNEIVNTCWNFLIALFKSNKLAIILFVENDGTSFAVQSYLSCDIPEIKNCIAYVICLLLKKIPDFPTFETSDILFALKPQIMQTCYFPKFCRRILDYSISSVNDFFKYGYEELVYIELEKLEQAIEEQENQYIENQEEVANIFLDLCNRIVKIQDGQIGYKKYPINAIFYFAMNGTPLLIDTAYEFFDSYITVYKSDAVTCMSNKKILRAITQKMEDVQFSSRQKNAYIFMKSLIMSSTRQMIGLMNIFDERITDFIELAPSAGDDYLNALNQLILQIINIEDGQQGNTYFTDIFLDQFEKLQEIAEDSEKDLLDLALEKLGEIFNSREEANSNN
ncbi:hypothetical protein TVAG_059380 [Trichomonas vaginalis G3]|uniref:Uncharacterized protein n=1 Tax=Trichomonas vaginalis (strain ATCC PRA-98 / G3) TaxID=412133 RepID=A2ERL3_TRIV3|nr:armadillo (ARM) repeat-containing protein family [Trichomonas vaginalis G3]EAY04740.1 hypothetical protein TVAG_059380 [Trichomonas vaginalis G3]KAI5526848.1 armadillo (ARM) repeat-containing protein family [Trichomonas vaginalis G3]|eukprot:XP_001316963.1 hypothetical protein [Trichomonas vaginalis G3]